MNSARLLAKSQKLAAVVPLSRASHTLAVPHVHQPVSAYKEGVPASLTRELDVKEKTWTTWSTSQALFAPHNPPINGMISVPTGEVWVTKSKKVLPTGSHFVFPFTDKVQAVKSPHTIVMGAISRNAKSKTGGSVDVYAVAYLKVTDFVKSTFFKDPESGRTDSEFTASALIRSIAAKEVAAGSDKAAIAAAIKQGLKASEAEFGLACEDVEIRGIYPSEANVAEKIRSLEQPLLPADYIGHNLSADYWAESLTPPFFESNKFGSQYEPVTPASVSLEWSIPSPPDYHHFNEVPRLTASVEGGKH